MSWSNVELPPGVLIWSPSPLLRALPGVEQIAVFAMALQDYESLNLLYLCNDGLSWSVASHWR